MIKAKESLIQFVKIEQQKQFEKDGFTVIDLLEKDQVEDLRAFYFANKEEHKLVQDKMHSTSDTHNLELILKVNSKIGEIVLPKLYTQLSKFDLLIGGFLVKEPGQGSETGFHQDPTLVDSSEFVSANVWIALQDTNHDNGNLSVIKGSHRLADMLVVTPQFPTVYNAFQHELKYYATELPIKAGQAIILNNKLIHGASINQTSSERLAIVMAIKSSGATWSFHYMDPNNNSQKIERYRIDLKSFASLQKNQRPSHAEFLGLVDFNFPQITYSEFLKFMHENYGSNSFFSRLKRRIAKWKG